VTSESRQSGIGLWSAVIAAAILAYSLSAGPSCWASSRWGDGTIVTNVYRPLTRILEAADNETLTTAFCWYCDVLAVRQFRWLPAKEKYWKWRRLSFRGRFTTW